MNRRRTLTIIATSFFGLVATGGLFLGIVAFPTAYPITASILFGCSLVVPGTLAIIRPRQWSKWAMASAAYCLVAGTIIAIYGHAHEWEVVSAIRSSWTARVAPEALKSRLAFGDNPDEVLDKMGISPGFLDSPWCYLVHGMDGSMVLEACGASNVAITSPRTEKEGISYLVWAYPICGGGCCEGAVVLTFQHDQLRKIEIYDPSSNPGPDTDVARHVDGRIWSAMDGSGIRFSAEKTLEQILSSTPAPQVVFEKDSSTKATGSDK